MAVNWKTYVVHHNMCVCMISWQYTHTPGIIKMDVRDEAANGQSWAVARVSLGGICPGSQQDENLGEIHVNTQIQTGWEPHANTYMSIPKYRQIQTQIRHSRVLLWQEVLLMSHRTDGDGRTGKRWGWRSDCRSDGRTNRYDSCCRVRERERQILCHVSCTHDVFNLYIMHTLRYLCVCLMPNKMAVS